MEFQLDFTQPGGAALVAVTPASPVLPPAAANEVLAVTHAAGHRWVYPSTAPGIADRAAALVPLLADSAPGLPLRREPPAVKLAARMLAARSVDPDALRPLLALSTLDAIAPAVLDGLPPVYACAADLFVERLARADARLAIIADYDCDGACAGAIIHAGARALGVAPDRISLHVPEHLGEGYGANERIAAEVVAASADLVVAVDLGTQNLDLFGRLALAGGCPIPVIVLDHHLVPHPLAVPPSVALCNPHVAADGTPVPSPAALAAACAAGLAYWFLRLVRRRAALPTSFCGPPAVALAGLASVADMVSLRPDAHGRINRALVAAALQVLRDGAGPLGLHALVAAAGLRLDDRVRAGDLFGWQLGPRINAGHRMGRSAVALRLLTAADAGQASQYAGELESLNRARRTQVERALTEPPEAPVELRRAFAGLDVPPVVFRLVPGQTAGTVGLVAGRLAGASAWPTFAFVADDLDGSSVRLAASGRDGGSGCDLHGLLRPALEAGLLRSGGGHSGAAALSVSLDHLRSLHASMVDVARAQAVADPESGWARQVRDGRPPFDIELPLGSEDFRHPSDLAMLAALIARLGPYGIGWPEPRVGLAGAAVAGVTPRYGRRPLAIDFELAGARVAGKSWRLSDAEVAAATGWTVGELGAAPPAVGGAAVALDVAGTLSVYHPRGGRNGSAPEVSVVISALRRVA